AKLGLPDAASGGLSFWHLRHSLRTLAGGRTSLNTTAFSAAVPFSSSVPASRNTRRHQPSGSPGLRVAPQIRPASSRYAGKPPALAASRVPALMSSTPFSPWIRHPAEYQTFD